MIVLKAQNFRIPADVAKFVNVNKIKREDILFITGEDALSFSIFFYGDSETEEITRGFFGW